MFKLYRSHNTPSAMTHMGVVHGVDSRGDLFAPALYTMIPAGSSCGRYNFTTTEYHQPHDARKEHTMFDATLGRQTITDKINALTDRFAAEFEDRMTGLPLSQQENFVNRLLEVMSDKDATAAFAQGNFAQNHAGQPAAALGAGTNGTGQQPTTEQGALAFLLNSGNLPAGIKAALRRLFNPQDPDHIKVGADGTPEVVGQLRQEVASKEADLRQERDPNHRGSLAQQLAAAQAASSGTGIDQLKTAVKAELDPVMEALGYSTGTLGGGTKLSGPDFNTVRDGARKALRLVS